MRSSPLILSLYLMQSVAFAQSHEQKQPNVLFICIDDLRTELGCYGSMVKSPHLDKLASEGSLFYNHYAQVPTSGASRACLLTGHAPSKPSDLSNEACRINISGKPEREQAESFIHHLRRQGYRTVGIGKISHQPDGYLQTKQGRQLELPHSWDEMLIDPGRWETGEQAFFGYADGSDRASRKHQVPPYERGEIDDMGYLDGYSAQLAIKKLQKLSQSKQAFCLAVGFISPHLPFNSPAKYWDLYQRANIPTTSYDIPLNTSNVGLHQNGEFNIYKKGDEKLNLQHPASEAYAKKLRHGYYSAISYTDAQIGKVLDELHRLGLDENTIIIVWGDHGWHLGDMRIWGKHTLLEPALKSTLIIKAPGKKAQIQNHRIVSSIDIYPTLMELCGIPCPKVLTVKVLPIYSINHMIPNG